MPVLAPLDPARPLEVPFESALSFLLLTAHREESFLVQVFPLEMLQRLIQLLGSTGAIQVTSNSPFYSVEMPHGFLNCVQMSAPL